MELKSFVEESINQIVEGLAAAGKSSSTHGAVINPRQPTWRYGEGLYFDKNTGSVLTNVEFDIAVTASEGISTKGGIGVAIASVMLGSQGESRQKNEHASRIKFNVPVVFPSNDTVEVQDKG